MRKLPMVGLGCLLIGGCAGAEATRTSANSLLIDAGAAPACGSAGAARVAAKAAAIETIKAGYDRYIITGGAAQNNLTVTQGPGTFRTTGMVSGGFYSGTTTYQPGFPIVAGSHDRQLGVVMFRRGDPGFENALDARQQLGPDWQDQVKNRILTCL